MAIWIAGACLGVRWSEQDLRRSEASVRALQTRVERLERQIAHLNIGERGSTGPTAASVRQDRRPLSASSSSSECGPRAESL